MTDKFRPFNSLSPEDQRRAEHYEKLRTDRFPRALAAYLNVLPVLVPGTTQEDIERISANIFKRTSTRKNMQHFVETTHAMCSTLLGVNGDCHEDVFEIVNSAKAYGSDPSLKTAYRHFDVFSKALLTVSNSPTFAHAISTIVNNCEQDRSSLPLKAAIQLFEANPATFGVQNAVAETPVTVYEH